MEAEGRLVGTVITEGLKIPIAGLRARLGGERNLARFLRRLTVVERPQPGRPRQFARSRRTAFRRAGGDLVLPRAQVPPLVNRRVLAAVEHARATETPAGASRRRVVAPARREPAEPFYEYQEAAINFICRPGGALSAAGGAAAYLEMGTGLGKSRTAMGIIARTGGPTLVVVPTDGIRTQWIDELREVYPGLAAAPYDNRRRNRPSAETHDVVFIIVNTARNKDPEFFAPYELVVLDEAHEYHSPVNSKVLWLAQAAGRVLGLSATPAEAPHGLDRVIPFYLGKPLVATRDIPGFDIDDVNFAGRVREVEYAGDPAHCRAEVTAAGTNGAVGTIGNVIGDPARLHLVAAEVARLCGLHETPEAPELGLGPPPGAAAGTPPRHHCVFVFAEHREYLPALRAALLERFAEDEIEAPELDDEVAIDNDEVAGGNNEVAIDNDDNNDVAEGNNDTTPVVLRGGVARAELRRAREVRVVLTTYGYSRRGGSLTLMTAIVLATPRRHGMKQILGRITRRGSDESILRIVVDIKDMRTFLKSQNTDRRKVYKEKRYPIYRVRADFRDFADARRDAVPTAGEELVWAPE